MTCCRIRSECLINSPLRSHGRRDDNQGSCYMVTTALIASCADGGLADESAVRIAMMFDHEEVRTDVFASGVAPSTTIESPTAAHACDAARPRKGRLAVGAGRRGADLRRRDGPRPGRARRRRRRRRPGRALRAQGALAPDRDERQLLCSG